MCMYSVPRTVLNTLQDYLIEYSWQLYEGLVLFPFCRWRTQISSERKNQDLDPGLFGSRNHGYLRRQFSLGSLKPTKCCSFLKEHMGKSPCPYGSNRDRSENQGRKQRAQDEVEGQQSPLLVALMFFKKLAGLSVADMGLKNGWPLFNEMTTEKEEWSFFQYQSIPHGQSLTMSSQC